MLRASQFAEFFRVGQFLDHHASSTFHPVDFKWCDLGRVDREQEHRTIEERIRGGVLGVSRGKQRSSECVYIYTFSLSLSLGEITRPSFVHIASWKTRLRRQNGACTVCPPVNWITWRKLRCKRRPNNF